MKIIIAHKYFFPRDGVSTHIFALAELLRAHGHEVIPFAMQHPHNEPSPYEKYFVQAQNFENPKTFLERFRVFQCMLYSREAHKKFEALVRAEKPDVVHIHNIYHHISPSILDVCRAYKIPVVQTVHDYHLVCPNYLLFSGGTPEPRRLFFAHLLADVLSRSVKDSLLGSLACAIELFFHRTFHIYDRAVCTWIVPSQYVKNILAANGIDEKKIIVLPHSVAVPSGGFRNSELKEDYFLCVGRLYKEKGFDVAIRALRATPGTLKIAGTGPEEEPLRNLARECGVENRVEFLGHQPRARVRALMSRARAVVVPSIWYEVFCYVVFEAWVAGTPVVASRIGALKEFVGALCPEMLFMPGDADGLARVLARITNNPKEAADVARAGREYIAKNLSPDMYIEKLLAVYRDA